MAKAKKSITLLSIARVFSPLFGVTRSERKALARLVPHMRSSGWLRSISNKESIDQHGNPVPWLSYAAINLLSERVTPDLSVFEYGSGNSTLWWAAHAGAVVSCEHDENWYRVMTERLPAKVRYLHRPLEEGNYPTAIAEFGSFDIVMIDGRERVHCTKVAVNHITPRGVVVFDNSDRERYAEAFSLLGRLGFRRLDLVSMGPISKKPISTSVFYRDGNCFGL